MHGAQTAGVAKPQYIASVHVIVIQEPLLKWV